MLQHFDDFYMTDDKALLLDRCTEVHALMKKAYWATDRELSAMREALLHSLNYAIFETASDTLVGFARVVTDYATVFYLNDVYIDENYRGRGLGKRLVQWIVEEEPKLSGIDGLLKTRYARTLYEKYGFEECQVVCMSLTRHS